jgi:hypothetical protein
LGSGDLMDTYTIASLLLLYIENQSKKPRVNYTEKRSLRGVPYETINFTYLRNTYEVQIYNSNFIIVKRLNNFGTLCNNIKDARNAIDSALLESELYDDYD